MSENKVSANNNSLSWKNMHPIERERMLLSLTDRGVEVKDIAKKLRIKEDTIIRFMRSRGYALNENEFITIQEKETRDILPVLTSMTPEQRLALTGDEGMQKIAKYLENYDFFETLIDNQEKLLGLLSGEVTIASNKENDSDIEKEEAIDILSTKIEIPRLTGELKRTSIRVNSDLFDRFNELWRSKYSDYKQHDLINKRFFDFYNKYR